MDGGFESYYFHSNVVIDVKDKVLNHNVMVSGDIQYYSAQVGTSWIRETKIYSTTLLR